MLGPGDRIGPLTIERELGVGGMGEVYLARDERLERRVAIKLLPATSGMDPGAHARMLREARSLSALKHPSIVTIHDIGTHAGLAYIVMEYVDGETFDAMIRRRGPLPAAEAVAVLAQVCDAVATAHDAGVLHRDLKSANLMIEPGGGVKVLDFGLSKRSEGGSWSRPPASSSRQSAPVLPAPGDDVANAPTVTPSQEGVEAVDAVDAVTAVAGDVATAAAPAVVAMVAVATDVATDATTPAPGSSATVATASGNLEPQTEYGAGMGTPGWAPPELIEGRPADPRTDVFSLGCVLYHLLTGKPPFARATWATQRARIEEGPAPPSRTTGVPAAFDAVIAAALSPDPDRRPADVRALVAAARAALARPRRARAIAIGVGVAVVGAGLVIAKIALSTDEVITPPVDAAPLPPPVPVPLTSLGGCAYSPAFLDDDTVAFDLTKDGAVDLYRLDLTPGAAPVRLTSDPGWEWRSSPGAPNEVLFQIQTETVAGIDALNLVTGARRPLATQEGPAVWIAGAYYYAPPGPKLRRIRDGRDDVLLALPADRRIDSIVATADGRRLGLLLFDERTLPLLCTTEIADPVLLCIDVPVNSARPAFSSTGDALYYGRLDSVGIARVPITGGKPIAVLRKTGIGGLAVSPKGQALVYSNCGSRSRLVSVLDEPNTPLVDDDEVDSPIIGPDGKILWVRRMQPRPAIMVRTRDGAVREHYVRAGAVLSQLAVAPNGDTIAFVVSEGSEPGIYLTRLNSTSPPNRITEDPKDLRPLFAGDHLVFSRPGPDGVPRLMQVGFDGSDAKVISVRPRVTIAGAAGRVLLSSPDGISNYWWDPATGKEVPAPPPPRGQPPIHVGLSPDAGWILFSTGANGQELWRARSDGSAPGELVYQLPTDRSLLTGTIDNRGHPVVAELSWEGELFVMHANPGAPW